MASSVSGQDEPNRTRWLATRAGKMEPSCPLGTTRCIPQAKFHQKPYNKSFIDQVCSVKMAGYWPRSFFASLWTSTSSRSINTQKKNLANIQPSWPHTWSITHTYYTSSTTAICLHVTRGIALIQHPNEGGHAWEQANIPSIPRPDLPLLLQDMTTIAPLHLAINMLKSTQSVNNFFVRYICVQHAAYSWWTRVSSLLTCRGQSLDLLAGFGGRRRLIFRISIWNWKPSLHI